MATVFVSRRRFAVRVYSNDHPPPHVHARGKGMNARFVLNCPDGPVDLSDYDGNWKLAQLQELGEEIASRLADCCTVWSEIHG
jgi:hypothetical protein